MLKGELYSEIRGTTFLLENWKVGDVVTPVGIHKKLQLRLDLFGQKVYYLKDEISWMITDLIEEIR